MGRSGIEYKEVQQAAITLLGQGVNPSIQRIRELLGTGSNSTIAGHLKRWQQELADTPRTALPPSVPETVMIALEQFWRVAAEQAEAVYQEQREAAARSVVAAEQARDEAIANLTCAQERCTALEHQMETLKSTVKTLEENLLVERERRTMAEDIIEAAEQRATLSLQAIEEVRSEAELRIQKLETLLTQYREDGERRLREAEQRLEYERERGEVSEAKLMGIIDQIRTGHAREQRRFDEERAIWKARELELQKRQEALHGELAAIASKASSGEERNRMLAAELKELKAGRQEQEQRQMDAVRLIELLHGELKLAATHQQILEKELNDCREALAVRTRDVPPFPASNQ